MCAKELLKPLPVDTYEYLPSLRYRSRSALQVAGADVSKMSYMLLSLALKACNMPQKRTGTFGIHNEKLHSVDYNIQQYKTNFRKVVEDFSIARRPYRRAKRAAY